jgi:hypothetical protein
MEETDRLYAFNRQAGATNGRKILKMKRKEVNITAAIRMDHPLSERWH